MLLRLYNSKSTHNRYHESAKRFQKCNMLRHQEMHTGTPEYGGYRHQGAVKDCLALRQVLPRLSVLAGSLRGKFLTIVSVSIYCILCRLSYCLSQRVLLQVSPAISFAISSLSKLLPRSPSSAEASSLLSPFWDVVSTNDQSGMSFRRGPRDHGLRTY